MIKKTKKKKKTKVLSDETVVVRDPYVDHVSEILGQTANSATDAEFKACKVVGRMITEGETMEDACKAVGQSRSNFWRVRQNNSKIAAAALDADESTVQAVSDNLFKMSMGYTVKRVRTIERRNPRNGDLLYEETIEEDVFIPGSPQAAIYFLNNRSKGKYKSSLGLRVESTHTERKELSIEISLKETLNLMTDEQLEELREHYAAINAIAAATITDDEPDRPGVVIKATK